MPTVPYLVQMTVYDKDSSAQSGATVMIRNLTKKTNSDSETTNSSGVAVIDMANIEGTAYEIGDEILMVAYYQNHMSAVKYTLSGSGKSQDLYLNYEGELNINTDSGCRIRQISVSNTDASTTYYAEVYDFSTGSLIEHIEVPAGQTQPIFYGEKGVGAQNGFVVFVENAALLVTVKVV